MFTETMSGLLPHLDAPMDKAAMTAHQARLEEGLSGARGKQPVPSCASLDYHGEPTFGTVCCRILKKRGSALQS